MHPFCSVCRTNVAKEVVVAAAVYYGGYHGGKKVWKIWGQDLTDKLLKRFGVSLEEKTAYQPISDVPGEVSQDKAPLRLVAGSPPNAGIPHECLYEVRLECNHTGTLRGNPESLLGKYVWCHGCEGSARRLIAWVNPAPIREGDDIIPLPPST
jgi:hypothetical protein